MDRSTPPRGPTIGALGRVTPTVNHNNIATKDSSGGSGSAAGLTNSLTGGNRSHGYCLKWKYHPNNLLHMFNQLLLNESFTDVVVACEGRVIKCHKMVLSACSKYFEQVFCEYPQQNSTLVILKDYSYNDIQAIIEFMYQGEINVAQDRLESLLKAAESLQVKGLADITGDGGGSTAVNPTVTGKEETEFMPSGHSADDSNPSSPSGALERKVETGSSSIPEAPVKKRRGRPPMTPHIDNSSMDGLMNLSTHQHMMSDDNQYEDFPTNMLEAHYTSPRPSKKAKRKGAAAATSGSGGGQGDLSMMDTHEDDIVSDDAADEDDVTEEDIMSIVKMTDYIEKGGSRPQFWDEPLTKKVMNAIKNKKMEMKAAAEYLGVSYSTLYSRYRELYGYLKMPANQDTNFNYYQVLNLLRAGQISLQDAAKRLNINERTLTAYLSTTITPKRPKTLKQGPSSLTASDSASKFAIGASGDGMNQNTEGMGGLEGGNQQMDEFDEEDSDSDEAKNLHLPSVKSEMEEGLWRTGR